MLFTVDINPPPVTASVTVIDETWAAPPPPQAPVSKAATPPAAQAVLVDPRIADGVAAMIAAAPERDPAPNRQPGLQAGAYGADAVAKFARGFSDAKVQPCLSPATGGLGLFAIPVIAVQALRGKCLMP